MLGGLEDSTLAQDHAEELLATAAAAKTAPPIASLAALLAGPTVAALAD